MRANQIRRMEVLEQAARPPENRLVNNALGNLLACGLIDEAIDLMQQGNRTAVRDMISASYKEGHKLTPEQVEWSVNRLATNLDWFVENRRQAAQITAQWALQSKEVDLAK